MTLESISDINLLQPVVMFCLVQELSESLDPEELREIPDHQVLPVNQERLVSQDGLGNKVFRELKDVLASLVRKIALLIYL